MYGSPPSSLPSVGKASATATEDLAAAMRSSGLYGEPRYPTNRSSEKPPFTNVSTSSGMRHTEVCISVVTPHFCPPVDDTQFRMMSWGMIMPEHIAPYLFVLPHRIANNPHLFSAGLTQVCKWFLSDGKFLVLESGKFLSP
jgi:hypothetical protein